MRDKLKGVAGMLIDINSSKLHETDMVKSVYRVINQNSSKKQHRIGTADVPMLVYTALMYDKNSPFRKLPIDDRKKASIDQAEFPTRKRMAEAISLSEERDLMIVSLYLRYQADESWAHYCTVSENYWKNQQMILKGATDIKEQESINKLVVQNTAYLKVLNDLKDTIFGDNKENLAEIVNFTPEDYVDELEKAQGINEDGDEFEDDFNDD